MRNIKFSRRSLLRGLGYGAPFCAGLAKNLYAQTAPRITRVAMFAYANGSHFDSEPTGSGTTFVLKPHMAPLEAVRNDLLVFKNLTMIRDPGNAHRGASFSVFGLGDKTSVDQLFASQLKATTPLASLELAVGQTSGDGGIIPGLSQVNGTFLPGANNPVAAYQRIADRITGGAPPPPTPTPPLGTPPQAGPALPPRPPTPPMGTPSQAEQALLRRKSVLDFVKADVGAFRGRLGPLEAAKMDLY